MTDMIERVARAICIEDGCDPDQIAVGIGHRMPEGKSYPLWHARTQQARAAIEAMREPTADMVAIALPSLSCAYGHEPEDAAVVWAAMVDAALRG